MQIQRELSKALTKLNQSPSSIEALSLQILLYFYRIGFQRADPFFFIAIAPLKPIPPVRPTARKVCLQPSLEPPAISPSPFFLFFFFFSLFCFLRSVVAFFLLFHPSLAVFGESGADLFKRRCYRRDSRGNGERGRRREEKREREKGRSLGRKYGDEFGLMLLEVA